MEITIDDLARMGPHPLLVAMAQNLASRTLDITDAAWRERRHEESIRNDERLETFRVKWSVYSRIGLVSW